VSIQTAATPSAISSGLGTFFAAGQAAQGPIGEAVAVTSLAVYEDTFGTRSEDSVSQTLYDAIDTFFQEGGQLAYISRVFPAASVAGDTAKLILVDRAGSPLNTLTVSALGPGVWGNQITVTVTTPGSGEFEIAIAAPGYETENSGPLTSPAQAVQWAEGSELVVITNDNSTTGSPNNNPANLSVTHLAGGAEGAAPAITDYQAALAAFVSDLGIGQVAVPGVNDTVVAGIAESIIAHAVTYNRFALLDAPDAQTAGNLESQAAGIQGDAVDPSYALYLTPYVVYPGIPTNTSTPPFLRNVPPSGAIAGIMARLSSQGNNADVAAAGVNGYLLHAVDVTTRYVDSDRATLEPAGVAVIRNYRSVVQLYGYTTLSLDPNWTDAGNARLRMQITDGVRQIGDSYVFADIDAQGHTASAFGGQINGYLNQLYLAGALYGATASAAFFVNVGATINTPTTASERELLASIGVRMSPTSEFVIIGITKYPVSQNLPS
jgi:hypothetical protein